MSKSSDLVQGTLDLLILKILALEPLHGFAAYIPARRAMKLDPVSVLRDE